MDLLWNYYGFMMDLLCSCYGFISMKTENGSRTMEEMELQGCTDREHLTICVNGMEAMFKSWGEC